MKIKIPYLTKPFLLFLGHVVVYDYIIEITFETCEILLTLFGQAGVFKDSPYRFFS